MAGPCTVRQVGPLGPSALRRGVRSPVRRDGPLGPSALQRGQQRSIRRDGPRGPSAFWRCLRAFGWASWPLALRRCRAAGCFGTPGLMEKGVARLSRLVLGRVACGVGLRAAFVTGLGASAAHVHVSWGQPSGRVWGTRPCGWGAAASVARAPTSVGCGRVGVARPQMWCRSASVVRVRRCLRGGHLRIWGRRFSFLQ